MKNLISQKRAKKNNVYFLFLISYLILPLFFIFFYISSFSLLSFFVLFISFHLFSISFLSLFYLFFNLTLYGTEQMRAVLDSMHQRNNWAEKAGFSKEIFDQEINQIFNASNVLKQRVEELTKQVEDMRQQLEAANKKGTDLEATLAAIRQQLPPQ